MTPIVEYLKDGELPSKPPEARALRIRAARYALLGGILYKKGYLQPWLRCVGPNQAEYVLQEMHFGSCGSHGGPRSLVRKAIRSGYYWPTMYRDAESLAKKCEKCQYHAPVRHLPQNELMSIQSPWPFAQWGIDLLGPFPKAPGGYQFLVVAIDYFSKWIEVEPLASITSRVIAKFLWKQVVCRYGIPYAVVSDNGRQFRCGGRTIPAQIL